jgi:fumarate hydratase class II
VRWGDETAKAIDNFKISGEPIPPRVVHWLGRIKAAAAEVNAELGLLDADQAADIASAGDAIAAGDHDAEFPIDVFQTGSGTSSNMNANEVISTLTDGRAHPNDDVNMGQSSNDVFPSAVHLAALEATVDDLLPALDQLARSLENRAHRFADVVKAGRTHLMDAVPVTLGQEFSGYAAQVRSARDHIQATLVDVGRIPLGGTAVGNGLNTHPRFAARVREQLAQRASAGVGERIAAPLDSFAAQAARDGLVALSGALKTAAVALTKICNDLRWMASGPRAGLGEIVIAELQKGSSIMPGKVNPVIPEAVMMVAAQVIGNDAAITVGGQHGNFELNVMLPLIAHNLLQSETLLASAARQLADKAIATFKVNESNISAALARNPILVTALNPIIGYQKAAAIAKQAYAQGRPVVDVAAEVTGMSHAELAQLLEPARLTQGGIQG